MIDIITITDKDLKLTDQNIISDPDPIHHIIKCNKTYTKQTILTQMQYHNFEVETIPFRSLAELKELIRSNCIVISNDINIIHYILEHKQFHQFIVLPNSINRLKTEQLKPSLYNCIPFEFDHFKVFSRCPIKIAKQHNINLSEEYQYLELVSKILSTGERRKTRNGYTYSVFGGQMKFDLLKGFPILTTRKMFLRGVFEELKLFISGKTDNQILRDKNVNIWNQNTTKEFITQMNLPYNENDFGPMYPFQWRHYGEEYIDKDHEYRGFDQLKECIDLIKNDPHSRRILMTSYNPIDAKQSVLYPCHGIAIQFYVDDHKRISCHMYQRSVDMLGLSWNISSYALLVHMIVKTINNETHRDYKCGDLYISYGDAHIYDYKNTIQNFRTMLERQPYPAPMLDVLSDATDLNCIEWSNIQIRNYISHDNLTFDMVP
jgi:thymidylate synthase